MNSLTETQVRTFQKQPKFVSLGEIEFLCSDWLIWQAQVAALTAQRDAAQQRRDSLAGICSGLMNYFERNVLNFQREKAMDYIHKMQAWFDEKGQP